MKCKTGRFLIGRHGENAIVTGAEIKDNDDLAWIEVTFDDGRTCRIWLEDNGRIILNASDSLSVSATATNNFIVEVKSRERGKHVS